MSRRQAMVGIKVSESNRKVKREDSVYDTMNKMIPSPEQTSSESDDNEDDDWVNN